MDLLNSILDGVGQAGQAVDKFTGGRALRGLAAGKPRELLSALPFSDTMGLTDEHDATSGRDVTDSWGLTDKGDNSFGSSAAGFGADMLLNPASLFGAGMAAKAAPTLGKGIVAGAKALSGADLLESLGGKLKGAGGGLGKLAADDSGALDLGAFAGRRAGAGFAPKAAEASTPAIASHATQEVDRSWGLNDRGYTGTNAGALDSLQFRPGLLDLLKSEQGSLKVPIKLASRGQTKAGRLQYEAGMGGHSIPGPVEGLESFSVHPEGAIPLPNEVGMGGHSIPGPADAQSGGIPIMNHPPGDPFADFRSRGLRGVPAGRGEPPLPDPTRAGLFGHVKETASHGNESQGSALLDFLRSEGGASFGPGSPMSAAGHSRRLLDFLESESGAARIPTRANIGRVPKGAEAGYELASIGDAAAARGAHDAGLGSGIEASGDPGYRVSNSRPPARPSVETLLGKYVPPPQYYDPVAATGEDLVSAFDRLSSNQRPELPVPTYHTPPEIQAAEPEMRSLPAALEEANIGSAARDSMASQSLWAQINRVLNIPLVNPFDSLKGLMLGEAGSVPFPKGKMTPNPIDSSARNNPWLNAESRSMNPRRFSIDPAKKQFYAKHRTERTMNPDSLTKQVEKLLEGGQE